MDMNASAKFTLFVHNFTCVYSLACIAFYCSPMIPQSTEYNFCSFNLHCSLVPWKFGPNNVRGVLFLLAAPISMFAALPLKSSKIHYEAICRRHTSIN